MHGVIKVQNQNYLDNRMKFSPHIPDTQRQNEI